MHCENRSHNAIVIRRALSLTKTTVQREVITSTELISRSSINICRDYQHHALQLLTQATPLITTTKPFHQAKPHPHPHSICASMSSPTAAPAAASQPSSTGSAVPAAAPVTPAATARRRRATLVAAASASIANTTPELVGGLLLARVVTRVTVGRKYVLVWGRALI